LHMLTDGIHANSVAQRIAMLLPGASHVHQLEDNDDDPST
jgi:hypothetical protein